MHNNKKNPKAKRIPTVEETNAALEKEFAEKDSKGNVEIITNTGKILTSTRHH